MAAYQRHDGEQRPPGLGSGQWRSQRKCWRSHVRISDRDRFSFENVVATLAGELGAHTALPNTGVGVIGTHAQTQYTSVQPDFDLEYETTYYLARPGYQ